MKEERKGEGRRRRRRRRRVTVMDCLPVVNHHFYHYSASLHSLLSVDNKDKFKEFLHFLFLFNPVMARDNRWEVISGKNS